MKSISYIFILLLLTTGCKKFVDAGLPENKLTTEKVFTSNETAISAMTAIYSQLINEAFPYKISQLTGLCSDELTNFSNSEICVQPYTNNLQPYSSPTNLIWTLAYKLIYQANGVYQGCDQSSSLNPVVKKQLMAEARFSRAFLYFNLVNLYGDVPLITSLDYQVNSRALRAPTSEVYKLIVEDLTYAQTNLNDQYVDISGLGTTDERTRPNKSAATALLSRVYLYLKDYQHAAQNALVLLQNKNQYDTVAVSDVFLKNNKEAIWQLSFPTPTYGKNTYEATNFIFTIRPEVSVERSSTISKGQYELFDQADLRKQNWIGSTIDNTVTPTITYYFPYKYKVKESDPSKEYSTILRLGEQYLIHAEASAQLGNLSAAIEDLNVVRLRAGIEALKSSSLDQIAILNAIALERRKELYTEFGHRWMDLKRTGKIDEVMNQVSPSKGSRWSTTQQLWPLPLTELQNDNNLKQNPGYN